MKCSRSTPLHTYIHTDTVLGADAGSTNHMHVGGMSRVLRSSICGALSPQGVTMGVAFGYCLDEICSYIHGYYRILNNNKKRASPSHISYQRV